MLHSASNEVKAAVISGAIDCAIAAAAKEGGSMTGAQLLVSVICHHFPNAIDRIEKVVEEKYSYLCLSEPQTH